MYPKDLKYTKTHEWIRVEEQEGVVGLTFYAQDHLGDIVFVELPEVGREVTQGEAFCVVESVKAVSDCYSPVSGEVVRVNENLASQPDLINTDGYGEGWIMAVKIKDMAELDNLLDVEAYEKHASEEEH
jgi:glycine cleavage system H protein